MSICKSLIDRYIAAGINAARRDSTCPTCSECAFHNEFADEDCLWCSIINKYVCDWDYCGSFVSKKN